MTDARLKSEWLNAMRFDALTDAAWRVFTGALMWSVDNGTDGAIPTRYLRMLHPDGAKPDAFAEIEKAGLWVATKDGFQLDDWDGALGQSTAAQVAAYKENAMKRARAYRERERAKLTKPKTNQPPVTGDVTRDVREHVGEGKGEGEGKGSKESEPEKNSVDLRTGEVSEDASLPSWPVVSIPGSTSDPGCCGHGVTVGARCRRCPDGVASARAA